MKERNSPPPRGFVVAVLLAGLAFAVHAPVMRCAFINYDDDVYVTGNEPVRAGLTADSFRWAVTTPHEGNWHPLTMISHMLDVEMWGLDPAGHHLTSLLLHAANVALLFAVLFAVSGSLWPSAFVAALFAVHPLNVASVAWIAERKSVLSTFFWLCALRAHVRFISRPGARSYLLVFALFVLGLASKPMVVTLPVTLLLLDWLLIERRRNLPLGTWAKVGRLAVEKVPMFVVAAAVGLATISAQAAAGAMQTREAYPLVVRLGGAVIGYAWYLWKMVWPADLTPFYPHPVGGLQGWKIALAGALVAGVSILVLVFRRRRYLTVGWTWYLATLVPVIGLIQVGSQAYADRYAYVPLIGPFAMVAWTATGLAALRPAWAPRAIAAAGVAAIVASSIGTVHQISYWRNSVTLFEHAVAVHPGDVIGRGNLGMAYVERGRLDDALAQFRAAAELGPQFASSHLNLGNALAMRGNPGEARSQYEEALRIQPEDPRVHYGLGTVLLELGQVDPAILHFRETLRLDPGHAKAKRALAALPARRMR